MCIYLDFHSIIVHSINIHSFRLEKSPAPPSKLFLKERSVRVLFVYLKLTGNYGSGLCFSLNSATSPNQSFSVRDYAVADLCWAGKQQVRSSGGCVSLVLVIHMLYQSCKTNIIFKHSLLCYTMLELVYIFWGEKSYRIAKFVFRFVNYSFVQVYKVYLGFNFYKKKTLLRC